MKKVFFIGAMLLCGMMMLTTNVDAQSARSMKKKAKKEAIRQQYMIDSIKRAKEIEALKAQDQVFDMPCQMYDDDEWFYATGVRQFKQSSINTAPTATLRSTQYQMRQKLQGVYRAVLRDYFDQMNTDQGSYANEHLESAGDLVIKATINETYEVCRKQSPVDANGNMRMYMAIKVSKKQFVKDLVQQISKDKELEVRFNEKQFRDSAFKVFKQSNEKEFNNFKEDNNQ